MLLGEEIVIVDGGARNKTWELFHLAPFCSVIAFEPHPEEYSKIISNKTDLERDVKNLKYPSYARIQYVDKALSDKVGTAQLNMTQGPGATSLLTPNLPLISQMEYFTSMNKRFPPQFEIINTATVQTTTLDKLHEEGAFKKIDYLKLDTQGNELDCLKGASSLLKAKKIGVIKTEVEFLELYNNQALFSDVDNFLRSYGFTLLDLSFSNPHKILWNMGHPKRGKGTPLFADAYYSLSFEGHSGMNRKSTLAHSLVLAELGFVSFAISLIQKCTDWDKDSRQHIESWLQRDTRRWKRKIKDWLKTNLKTMDRIFSP